MLDAKRRCMSAERFCLVVGLDLSEYAEIVLEHAIDQAARHDDVDLHVVTVAHRGDHIDEVKRQLTGLVAPGLELLGDRPWRAHVHVRAGDPANEIANLAADVCAQLIVVGRFGLTRHRWRRRLGSVAARVIELSPCPTLVVGMVEGSAHERQCPKCVAVRARTDGEVWFCPEHSAPDRELPVTAFARSSTFTDGGLMW
jgi:nucleotide-binding universal stress UspA family protein